jgi:hypothetical protein
VASAQEPKNVTSLWQNLLTDATSLNLPTKFLGRMPPDFVHFEFDDLRTFAAEYHPEDHRMVLDRGLSLNRAGGVLRPLRQLSAKEIQTLYHELFHAFMDYLVVQSMSSGKAFSASDPLLEFAREQQHCRYERVLITPIPQKKGQTEERFLDEAESWEAINETWAVFVGWALWTQIELQSSKRRPAFETGQGLKNWLERLVRADKEADLLGYYEPRDRAEKAIARKRFLAPEYRISPPEIAVLMKDVLGSSADSINRTVRMLKTSNSGRPPAALCRPTVHEGQPIIPPDFAP